MVDLRKISRNKLKLLVEGIVVDVEPGTVELKLDEETFNQTVQKCDARNLT